MQYWTRFYTREKMGRIIILHRNLYGKVGFHFKLSWILEKLLFFRSVQFLHIQCNPRKVFYFLSYLVFFLVQLSSHVFPHNLFYIFLLFYTESIIIDNSRKTYPESTSTFPSLYRVVGGWYPKQHITICNFPNTNHTGVSLFTI